MSRGRFVKYLPVLNYDALFIAAHFLTESVIHVLI